MGDFVSRAKARVATYCPDEANKALEKSKIMLMQSKNAVFFCHVMLSLKHIWDATQPTAYTDGRVIGYNPEFFLLQSTAERIGLMLHETLHVALFHVCRTGDFDPLIFNMAADYVINLMIIEAGFKLPKGGLYDKKYAGMSTEEVYVLLKKENVQPPKEFMLDIKGKEDPQDLKNDIDEILIQAVLQSEASSDKAGSVPQEIQFYVDGLVNPVIPWNRLMKSYMTQFAKDDYSYQRINKRFMPEYLLPSLYSEKVCDIAVGTDVSGSVTDLEYTHYCAETMALLKWLKPGKTHFIQFDTNIKSVYELNSLADFSKVEFTGRGGTRIDPLMEWAKENKPACLIVFSDGDFSKPSVDPKIPVLWIVHSTRPFKPPFGKVIPFIFNP